MRKFLATAALAGAAFAMATPAAADFPERELKFIVNYGSGGGVDRTARSMQRFLPDAIGQSVIVENHAGAGGMIGLREFLDQPRDGYTILTAFAPATTVVNFQHPDLFDLDDLAIINIQWIDPAILVAHENTGWTGLGDMVEDAKANPGQFSFSEPGRGAPGQLLAVVLFDKLGLDINMAPYDGGGDARAALQGEHVEMTGGGAGGMLAVEDIAVPLGVFGDDEVGGWPDAESVNSQLEEYGVTVPDGAAYRFFAVHRDVKENHPERWEELVEAFRKTTTEHEPFLEFCEETQIGCDWLGPEKSAEIIDQANADFTEILEEYWD